MALIVCNRHLVLEVTLNETAKALVVQGGDHAASSYYLQVDFRTGDKFSASY